MHPTRMHSCLCKLNLKCLILFSHFLILVKELLSTVESLRQKTKKNLKSAMADRAKKYTPKMRHIQCKLRINKHNYRVPSTDLVDYPALFGPTQKRTMDAEGQLRTNFGRKQSNFCNSGQRMLVEGDIATGKTVMTKKMAWDWAESSFSSFDIVFYISLKLVRPGDTLEQVIIDQYQLEGVTVSKLTRILDKIGDKCLFILDELDEHVQGWSSEFIEMIRSQENSHLNILLTRKPETESNISQFFPTAAKIEFCSYKALEKVISKSSVPKDISLNEIVHQHLDPSLVTQNNPMLTMFLCVLFDNKIIDVNTRTIALGDLYTKIFYVANRSISQEGMMKKGKTAFEALLKPVVITEEAVGPHTTLQTYAAAYYFVHASEDTHSLSILLDVQSTQPIFSAEFLVSVL